MIQNAKAFFVNGAGKTVVEHIQGVGDHFRYFYQDVLRASLEGEAERIPKLAEHRHGDLKKLRADSKLIMSMSLVAGVRPMQEWIHILANFLKEHREIGKEVMEQIDMAKGKTIHPMIAASLSERLTDLHNRFVEEANRFMDALEKRHKG